MTTRKQPLTSILAHESIKESKQAMYVKIIEGLKKLKVGGTFYEISEAAGIKPAQCWKRLSEIEGQFIYKTGITRPGESGRLCSVWQLMYFDPKIEIVEKSSVTVSKNGQLGLF